MPKGRPADLELVSAEARAALLARAGGDSKSPQYKRELMHALRAAKKQRETDALTAIALAEPTNQLHFAGEEFDPALYDTNHMTYVPDLGISHAYGFGLHLVQDRQSGAIYTMDLGTLEMNVILSGPLS